MLRFIIENIKLKLRLNIINIKRNLAFKEIQKLNFKKNSNKDHILVISSCGSRVFIRYQEVIS